MSKGLIIVLVVIVVLFVATIAIGAGHGSGSSDRPGAVSALKGLQGSRFLTIGDKASTTCPQLTQAVLQVAGSCVITLDKRSFFSSPTRVAIDVTGSVTVTADTKNGPPQTSTVDGQCYGTAVDHNGGTITLLSFSATTITLRTAACPS